jgi:membrane fusion protein (multidrug efflux system)
MIIMLVAVALFLAAIGFVKYQQIQAAIKGGGYTPPPEAVTTVVAHVQEWPSTLNAVGTVEAERGVTLSADLPGTVARIAFTNGARVAQGTVLVELDTRQERAQLASVRAQRDLAKLTFDRAKGLLSRQVIAQAEFDQAEATYKQAEANVGTVQATIDRKTVRAPFSGKVGIRQVNLGQYVGAGDPIVALQSLDRVYVNFNVPQQNLEQVRINDPIRVEPDSTQPVAGTGRVTAINSVIDESTRNVQVQATFQNKDGRLHPGMYVNVVADVGRPTHAITLPATAILYAPYGNSVYVLRDTTDAKGKKSRVVSQHFVTLGGTRGDQVAIAGGVIAGDEVVTSGVFKLRPGAAVIVNNKIMPSNSANPKPEDS